MSEKCLAKSQYLSTLNFYNRDLGSSFSNHENKALEQTFIESSDESSVEYTMTQSPILKKQNLHSYIVTTIPLLNTLPFLVTGSSLNGIIVYGNGLVTVIIDDVSDVN